MENKLFRKVNIMKTIKYLTCSLFPVTCSLALALALSAQAVPIWTELTTEGAKGDTSGDFANYTAYFCTKESAAQMFEGNDTYDTVVQYLTKSEANYAKGMGQLQDGSFVLNAYGYDEGQYTFSRYLQSALSGDYIAVIAYAGASSDASAPTVRVFGSKADAYGDLAFDTSVGASDWTTVTVPEPTSGLLMLLALAGLALKRKQK